MVAALLLMPLPAAAQLKLGESSNHLSGTISTGYTASYGNLTDSTHNWTVGGAATLSGSYYSPNFLSYNASFYLNQSSANSNFQSISNASGVNVTANIFSGSHYPGAVTYSKAYNSEGNYAIPGMANYVTHGNSDSFGVTWSENAPRIPSLSAGYQFGNSQYSVYGTNEQGTNSFHSLNLHSGYLLAGFNMGAYYTRGGGDSLIPQAVTGLTGTRIVSDDSALGFNVSHRLPMSGSASAAFNRSDWNSDYLGIQSTGTIDTVNALAAVHPTYKLSFTASADYSDNLAGQLYQSIIEAGSAGPGINTSDKSNSLDLLGVASYTPMANLQTSASVERRSQQYLGQTYGVTSYSVAGAYSRELLDGALNTALSLTDNVADNTTTGENTLGFSATANYAKLIADWHVNGSFGYAQNVQTLLVTYMNSYYHFSANVRRSWRTFNVSLGAGGARSGLTNEPGSESSSQNYDGSVGYSKWITASGGYSRSSGQAIATGGGLVPIPIPPPVVPSSLVSLYGGDSYSVSLGSSPIKRLTLSGSYSKSSSNTSSESIISSNHNNQENALIQYQYRKLYFTSGYARLEQGFSASGTPPEVVSSFYIGVSRWFNFF